MRHLIRSYPLLVCSVLVLVAAGTWSVTAPAHSVAAGHSTLTASATKDGLTLTLRVARGPYPRGSALPVTLQLRNHSSGIRVLWVWSCHNPPYGVQVLSRSGRVVYPRPSPRASGLPCTDNMAPALAPNRSSTYHVNVILDGPLIRGRIPFGVPKSTGDTVELLTTKTITVGDF